MDRWDQLRLKGFWQGMSSSLRNSQILRIFALVSALVLLLPGMGLAQDQAPRPAEEAGRARGALSEREADALTHSPRIPTER